MKELDHDPDKTARPNEGKRLRLVHSERRESLFLDLELKTLIEKIKGKQKRVRLRGDEGPDAA